MSQRAALFSAECYGGGVMLQSRIYMHMWCAFFTLTEVYSVWDACQRVIVKVRLTFFCYFLCRFEQGVIYLPKILYLR